MKKYIFEQLILNFFIFGPLVMGVSAGYQQQARERHAAGTQFRSGWWIKVCSWGVMFYTACFALWCWIAPDFNFFWDYIKYGVPPIAVYVVACKLVSLSYQNWVPVTVSKSPRSSAIHKYYDIFDTSNMWKVLTVTVDYGSPLVCLGNEHEIDPNNPDRIYTAEEKAWCIADDKARVSNEDRGLVVGAPGSGKTTYLVAQLIDWMESGKSFVATDIKPEIWGILKENGVFDRFGYTDWVINPTDTASHHYNIFSEAMSSAELNEILAVVIPNTDESAEVFAENARRLLKAVIMELGKGASLPACQRYINRCDDVPELLKQLRQSDNEVVVSIAKDITRTAKTIIYYHPL